MQQVITCAMDAQHFIPVQVKVLFWNLAVIKKNVKINNFISVL